MCYFEDTDAAAGREDNTAEKNVSSAEKNGNDIEYIAKCCSKHCARKKMSMAAQKPTMSQSTCAPSIRGRAGVMMACYTLPIAHQIRVSLNTEK